MKRHSPWRRILVSAFFGLGMPSTLALASDDPVVIVLSSNLGPYKEALQGFQEAFGHAAPFYVLSEGEPTIPSGTRVIIAIGGKAATHAYSSKTFLIYCLAPGTLISHDDHAGPLLKIHTSPSATVSVAHFKELQPSLKRLAVLWAGDSIQDYINQQKEVAARFGVELISTRVQNPNDLPDRLRALRGKVDGLWMPPDAGMVTPKNFATIKEFSLGNNIPFYVPSDSLVEQGAMASVSASFAEIGALAAKMAREALQKPLSIEMIFPETAHVAVSLASAKNCGLKIPPEALKQVEKVLP